MRPVLGLFVTLCVLPGCRDKDHGPLDQKSREAAEQVGAARAEVASGQKAVAEERADVVRAQAEGKPASTVVKEQADVARTTGELAADQAGLASARAEFLTRSQVQLDALGRRIDEAAARHGATAADKVAWLRKDHAQLARIRAKVVDDPQVDWREAGQQFDTQVNTVEENLNTITTGR